MTVVKKKQTGGSKFGPGGFENPSVGGQTIGGGAGGAATPQVQGDPGSPCLISWPSTSLPLVGSVGGGCIISKTNVRAWVGGGLILFSATGVVVSLALLVAIAFKRAGALDKAAQVASFVPGGGKAVGAGLRVASGVAG
jgi:hypothetical protein